MSTNLEIKGVAFRPPWQQSTVDMLTVLKQMRPSSFKLDEITKANLEDEKILYEPRHQRRPLTPEEEAAYVRLNIRMIVIEESLTTGEPPSEDLYERLLQQAIQSNEKKSTRCQFGNLVYWVDK